MFIDENKYNTLFISKFKANETEFKSEFERVIRQYGQTEEVKLKFYETAFKTLITQFKRDLPKDENYDYIITTLYNYFIRVLKDDGIETSEYETELMTFRATELPTIKIQQTEQKKYIPEYKTYNLNTKYGRRKAREQAIRNYENGTPEYRSEIDKIKVIVWVVIILVTLVIFLLNRPGL